MGTSPRLYVLLRGTRECTHDAPGSRSRGNEISLPRPTIFDDARGLGMRTGYRGRISVDVHDALNLMIAGSASKELAFVIKLIIAVRATPR